MKQVDQVAWSLSRGFEGKVEGLDPRLQDIAVYTNILKVINARMVEKEAAKENPSNFTIPYPENTTTSTIISTVPDWSYVG